MPVDPHLETAPSHGLARGQVFPKTGVTGAAGGDCRQASAHADYDKFPLGTTDVGLCTSISPTPGDGQVSFTYSEPAGGDRIEVIVRVNATNVFVKKVADAASPVVVSGLTNGVEYAFYFRAISADGALGKFAAKVTSTPSA